MDELQKAIHKVKAKNDWTSQDMDGYNVGELLEDAEKIDDSVLDNKEYWERERKIEQAMRKFNQDEDQAPNNEFNIGDRVNHKGKQTTITGRFLPSTVWRYQVKDDQGHINYYWEHELCHL